MVFMISRHWSELKTVSAASIDLPTRPFSERIKSLNPAAGFSSEKFLKKFFMRLKIILLRSERKVDGYLHKVSHSQKFEEDYWDKVKKGE